MKGFGGRVEGTGRVVRGGEREAEGEGKELGEEARLWGLFSIGGGISLAAVVWLTSTTSEEEEESVEAERGRLRRVEDESKAA